MSVPKFDNDNVMWVVGIERGESRGGYCSCEREARGPVARAVRGAGNVGRRASPTAGKREGFSF
jgi:hypothetical protein